MIIFLLYLLFVITKFVAAPCYLGFKLQKLNCTFKDEVDIEAIWGEGTKDLNDISYRLQQSETPINSSLASYIIIRKMQLKFEYKLLVNSISKCAGCGVWID